jgi:hypothetical protein
MLLSLDTVVSQASASLSAEVAGEVVIMMMNGKSYYALDPVGTDVWSRLGAPRTVADLCEELKREYDAPRERIEQDVLTLLSTLVEAGAVDTVA